MVLGLRCFDLFPNLHSCRCDVGAGQRWKRRRHVKSVFKLHLGGKGSVDWEEGSRSSSASIWKTSIMESMFNNVQPSWANPQDRPPGLSNKHMIYLLVLNIDHRCDYDSVDLSKPAQVKDLCKRCLMDVARALCGMRRRPPKAKPKMAAPSRSRRLAQATVSNSIPLASFLR